MSWILDILLIGIVLGTIFFYWHRGFVRSILTFGRVLISSLAATLFGPKIGDILADMFLSKRFTTC